MCSTHRFSLKLSTFEIRGSHSGVAKKVKPIWIVALCRYVRSYRSFDSSVTFIFIVTEERKVAVEILIIVEWKERTSSGVCSVVQFVGSQCAGCDVEALKKSVNIHTAVLKYCDSAA